MNIKNLIDHKRLLKFGNCTDLCNSDYPIKGYGIADDYNNSTRLILGIILTRHKHNNITTLQQGPVYTG